MCMFMGFLSLLNNLFHLLYVSGTWWFHGLMLFLSGSLTILFLVSIWWCFLFYLWFLLFVDSFDLIIYLIILINGRIKLLLFLWIRWHFINLKEIYKLNFINFYLYNLKEYEYYKLVNYFFIKIKIIIYVI